MIKFVNAKINIGLNIVGKREDGYHDLETVFFPVGLESGMPQQPDPFDDILEISLDRNKPSGCRFQLMGRRLNCAPEKNLVVRAATLFFNTYYEKTGRAIDEGLYNIILDKHLPDGAGLGGGSADASFCLVALNEMFDEPFSKRRLAELSAKLGADCPFFIYNTPSFAEGIGEVLTPVDIDLKGCSLLIVKPDVSVSTKEAFSGITPRKPKFDLRFLPDLPLEKWREYVVNDFEESIFPLHPELGRLKEEMYEGGAVYASMSGSGSALYAIYRDAEKGSAQRERFVSTYSGVWLFGL
ncbi:MAG: 4-(cytidine 5'-diphospho)-2-C-methyl-D-erythritol kinase [Muribaculaceae bacterium]|nr:4-(cytidine 5'-diphospho)-2-C-methyl-D-erythritol kinase [Muribaculaceae bacterium]